MSSNTESPYFKDPASLNNVISAIQVMGTYKFYKLDIEKWAQRIKGEDASKEYWKNVFKNHPEFFRLDDTGEKASLVWRRSQPKLYDVDKEEPISKDTYKSLSDGERTRISRAPLEHSDIETLISTAIQLHTRAIEYKKEKRWWINPLISASGALLGVIIGMFFAGYIESEKQKVILSSKAIETFAESTWIDHDPKHKKEDQRKYIRLINRMAIYAPTNVIEALGNYHASECNGADDNNLSPKCKKLWSQVVVAMRDAAEQDEVKEEGIRRFMWGDQ